MDMMVVWVKELAILPRQDNCWCQGLMQLKESCHLIKRWGSSMSKMEGKFILRFSMITFLDYRIGWIYFPCIGNDNCF